MVQLQVAICSTRRAVCQGLFLSMLLALSVGQLTVNVSPKECGANGADCRTVIASAIERCRQHQGDCSIVLAPGRYRVTCPIGTFGDYDYIFTPGAVDLSNTSGVTFGAASSESPARIDVDYISNGCPAVAASAARDLAVRNLVLDTERLPFSFGSVLSTSADRRSVRYKMSEPERSEWDTTKYPWLRWVQSGAVNGLVASSWDSVAGVATLNFSSSAPAQLMSCTSGCLLKHFANMESWGLYGWKVQGFYRVTGVVVHSAAGMGVRCDFCNGTFSWVDSAVAPAPGRPMSSTADGVHFMHHRGSIVMRNSTVDATGDDCFNSHGNFIVLSHFSSNRRSAHYIDETGPGWIPGLGQYLVGDRVAFFSRLSLQQIGAPNQIVSGKGGYGENATLRFQDPIPAGVLRYDMLISLDRTTSLDVEGCSFSRGGRGLVVSGTPVRIVNNLFRGLGFGRGTNSVLFLQGGCGAYEDYTEGNAGFSKDILIENNLFDSVPQGGQPLLTGKTAAIQLAGCRPRGSCDHPPPGPAPPSPIVPPPSNTLGPTPMSKRYSLSSQDAQYLRAVPVRVDTANNITALMYYDSCTSSPPMQRVSMGIYSDVSDKPGQQLRLAGHWQGGDAHCAQNGWRTAPLLEGPLQVQAGQRLWLLHRYASGAWDTVGTLGMQQISNVALQNHSSALPSSLFKVQWQLLSTTGVPLRIELGGTVGSSTSPEYPPCEAGGSTKPPVVKHPSSLYPAGFGRITEPGAVLENFTVYRNVTVRGNVLGQGGRLIDVGATEVVSISSNTLKKVSSTTSGIRLYSSTRFDAGKMRSSNACQDSSGHTISCVVEVRV